MDTDIIWSAGFMDGEGTITIKRYKRYETTRYQLYVSCGQVEKEKNISAILLLQKLYGGSVSKWTQRPQDGDRIDTISWSVVSNDAYNFILKTEKYLKIKDEQAKLGKEFFEETKKPVSQYRLTKEDLDKRAYYWTEMRKFNVKGRLQLQRLNEETAKADVIV